MVYANEMCTGHVAVLGPFDQGDDRVPPQVHGGLLIHLHLLRDGGEQRLLGLGGGRVGERLLRDLLELGGLRIRGACLGSGGNSDQGRNW